MKRKIYRTDIDDAMLEGLDISCKADAGYPTAEAELGELYGALDDWELLLHLDIRAGLMKDVRSDRAQMQRIRLKIREIKAKESEQMSSCKTYTKEIAAL